MSEERRDGVRGGLEGRWTKGQCDGSVKMHIAKDGRRRCIEEDVAMVLVGSVDVDDMMDERELMLR